MCIVCADMSGQLRRSDFISEEIGRDISVSASQRAGGAGPLAFLDLDERGGVTPNGKVSFTPAEAGAHITRSGLSWAALGQPATVTYAFRSTQPFTMPSDTSGFSRFSAQQIAATELMLQGWSDVARITFNRIGTGTEGDGAFSNEATMLFGNYSSGQGGAAAFAYLPGSTSSTANAGDVWVNSSLSYNSAPVYLAYGYQVLLHEIGHAIGLSHPGAYNAGPGVSITYANHAEYYEDSRQYSVMSYFNESNTGGAFGGRYSSAPLLDDIAAAQRLYGANMTTRTGDTVYGFNSNAGRIWYSAGDQLAQQAVIFAVWDAGGTDTLDFQYYNNGGVIDLRQGHFSSVGGLTGNVSIAMGAVIENAIGGAGAEIMIGNSAANVLRGNGGNDQIEGGNGSDTAVFTGNRALYTVTAGTEVVGGVTYGIITVSGPDGTDVLRNVEFLQFADQTIAAPALSAGIRLEGDATAETLTGTSFADWLFGGDGIDTLNGGDGNDRLAGGRGNDTLNGGAGIDEADYSGANGGVSVNLGSGTAVGTGADGTDTLNSIENVRGSRFSDTIFGDAGANVIRGGGGVDNLIGGGGNDTLIAGDGVLTSDTAPDVNKAQGTANISRETAVNVDGNFDLDNDPGFFNPTVIPHAKINATANGGGKEYYAFTVTAGASCIFDINGASFDSVIEIFNSDGTRLAINDDGGSDGTNSYLNHTFGSGGTYYIAVSRWVSGSGNSIVMDNPPAGSTYGLNISIPGHSVPNPQSTGSDLNGGDGDDTLVSGSANDDLTGGSGTDTAVFTGARAQYTITQTGPGAFTVVGPDGTDRLIGVEFAQFSDIVVNLSASSIDGTAGPDTLTGTDNPDTINGFGGNDTLRGMGGDDVLNGGEGNDLLDGGAGADTMTGGAGDDIYIVGSAGDQTIEQAGGGTDTVRSYANWTLAAHVENLELLGTTVNGTGNVHNNRIVGNASNNNLNGMGGNDELIGGAGDDVLDGGAGSDIMQGGVGNDTYVVDSAGDQIIELVGEGIDTVRSWLNRTLTAGLENLELLGTAVNGFGNELDNVIVGSDMDNFLYGRAGNDIIRGGLGDDTLQGDDGDDLLDGGAGADKMLGGAGNDTYIVAHPGDSVFESADQGYDTVQAYMTFTMTANIEALVLMGSGQHAGYGNSLANAITGNNDANILWGRDGDDVLHGMGGNDTLYGESGLDTLYGGDGDDWLNGGVQNDVLYGGSGADRLDGGAGDDVMTGGTGNDTYVVGSALDQIVELVGEGTDTVLSYVNWTLGDHLENLTLMGGALVGTGNGLANALTGNGSNNTLNGMGGNDTLTGAGGNDIFVFTGGFGADVITDFSAGAGIGDRIRLETSWMADF
uniref:M10 family metallopeptidase C-terminal domain-containing protein n=1 Tax=Brevundimonas sp. TaxID=1871086 RepID=UPI0025FD5A08